MTEKLYYQDPFLASFASQVTECRQEGDTYWISLKETAFYPEGGGQPCDLGTLNGSSVIDVQERDGEVWHKTAAPIPVQTDVRGVIDWERRFDHMQQHSGEHIVSGMICSMYSCSNVGFHMGTDVITIDYDTEITREDLAKIEDQANQYLYEDHPVSIWYPSQEELEQLAYRSKKKLTGAVRIVSFPGADCCACCGTHVRSSGQVGLVKLLSAQKFHEGTRLTLLCGKRAFRYFSELAVQNEVISHLFSAKPLETAKAAERIKNELASVKTYVGEMETSIIAGKAEEYRGKGNVTLFFDHLSPDSVRRYAIGIMETCGGRCAVFSGSDTSYQYAIGWKGENMRSWCNDLNQTLRGRGGGKPEFIQGSVQASREEIEQFLT